MAPGQKRSGGRIFFILAIVIVLLLVAAVVAIQFLPRLISLPFNIPGVSQAPEEVVPVATPTPPTVKVVVAVQPIAKGDVLNPNNVMESDMPVTEYYTEGLFISDINEVLNKRARIDLQPGTPLSKALIVDKGSLPSFDIPENYVAISIPISRLGVLGYALENGDHVNVITTLMLVDLDPNYQTILPNLAVGVIAPGETCTLYGEDQENCVTELAMKINAKSVDVVQGRTELDPAINQPVYIVPSEPQRPRLVSQTLIQDAIVLYVGEFSREAYMSGTSQLPTATPVPAEAAPAEGQAPPPAPVEPVKPDIITLVVSPQDAVTLNYLVAAGAKINLALRRAGDASRIQTEAVTLQFIMDQYTIPLPAKQPYGTEKFKDDTLVPAEQPVTP